jgi:hypothetical protein
MLIVVSLSLFCFSYILGKHYFPFSQELFFLSFPNIYFLTIEFNIYPRGYAIHILYTLHSPLTRTFINRRLGLWCRMIFTLYRVCTKLSLPSTECARNEHYLLLSMHQTILFWVYAEWSYCTFYWVCKKWSLPYTDCARNDLYCTFYWVCKKWSLPYTDCARNDLYCTFYWVCTKWSLPYTDCARNDLYCTFYWVCTKWSLPSTECARNDLHLILSVQEMIITFYWSARNDLHLILSVRRIIFTLSVRWLIFTL